MTNSRDLFAAVRAPRAVSEGAFALNVGELRDAAPCRAGFADGRHSLARPSKAARDCWRSRAPLSAPADRLRVLLATLPPCQRRAAPLHRDGSCAHLLPSFHSKREKEVARWQVTEFEAVQPPWGRPLAWNPFNSRPHDPPASPRRPRDSQLGPTQPLSRYSPQLGPSQLLVHPHSRRSAPRSQPQPRS